ncbi:ribosome maturation factor RimM [Pseudogemmobacter sp. W21_MBD1_M6]|uniref:ribosome maturation factor RimM n=1 Tax=Pseudogemmobacter sp. W21_MBD1_M6 TaxID=3240271 RepID=UPI003F954638
MSEDKICVGALSGSYGVHGEVRLKSFCADPQAIADYGPLSSEDGKSQYVLTLTGSIPNGFTAEVEGIKTKEQADALKGIRLYAPRSVLPALPDDEYYHADLIGLTVLDTGGAVLGTVKFVQNHGAGDLLEVMRTGGGETVLVPFTMEVVPTVDLASGRVIIDPPEGLF